VRIALEHYGLSPATLAELARAAGESGARHTLLNDYLVDTRQWHTLAPEQIAAQAADDPLAVLALWELTEAAGYLATHLPSEAEFLAPFADPKLLQRMVYLDAGERIQLDQVYILPRRGEWDLMVLLHLVLRWAVRFGALQPYERREFTRLNLQYPFTLVVAGAPASPHQALLLDALRQCGVAIVPLPAEVPPHNLAAWLHKALGLQGEVKSGQQRRLEFREAGNTENSLFVVRAMGGVDGYVARGALGPDLGLIIDIGDRQVSVPATAHLEYEVVRLINKYTPLHAERQGGSLLLRWYDTQLGPDDLGRIIYETLKKQFTLSIISVNIIFDPLRISSLMANIFSYKDQREIDLARRTEESAPFVVCRACACYAPYAFCVATVARPPCCGRSYDELAALAQFTHGMTQFTIEKGICEERTKGCFMGVDKTARLLTEGRLRRLGLHSLREQPHPTTAIPECIAYYQDELEVLVILSRDYPGRAPDGKTYETLLARVAGRAIPGFAGVSEQYILSNRFLAADGGLSAVGWMNSALKRRLKIRAEHIATEDDAVNIAALKEFLTTWRHG
jgi:hypothetical protein